jgi:hypothetical protein
MGDLTTPELENKSALVLSLLPLTKQNRFGRNHAARRAGVVPARRDHRGPGRAALLQTELRPDRALYDLGHLPIDGVDLLFEITSRRYERAPMVITTNRVTCAAVPRPE